MEEENNTKPEQEVAISFDSIVDNCETIGDLQSMESQIQAVHNLI